MLCDDDAKSEIARGAEAPDRVESINPPRRRRNVGDLQEGVDIKLLMKPRAEGCSSCGVVVRVSYFLPPLRDQREVGCGGCKYTSCSSSGWLALCTCYIRDLNW